MALLLAAMLRSFSHWLAVVAPVMTALAVSLTRALLLDQRLTLFHPFAQHRRRAKRQASW